VAAFKQVFSDFIETSNTFIFNGYYLGGELDYPNALVSDHVSSLALAYERFFVVKCVSTAFFPTRLPTMM
jgi:feruloyl esterase